MTFVLPVPLVLALFRCNQAVLAVAVHSVAAGETASVTLLLPEAGPSTSEEFPSFVMSAAAGWAKNTSRAAQISVISDVALIAQHYKKQVRGTRENFGGSGLLV